jgi:hypothetical protein
MKARPLADLLLLFVGPAVWFAHFTILYGAEALICTPPVTTAGAMTWIGIAATLVALAVLTVFAAMLVRSGHLAGERGEQSSPAFLHGVALLLALLSALGAIWTAFPIALLRVCASTGG